MNVLPFQDLGQIIPIDRSTSHRLVRRFGKIRQITLHLTAPLALDDFNMQPMPDVSPPKWHLAHSSWFFENVILMPFKKGYRPYNPLYQKIFNSYYNALGPQHPRPERGNLSRPTVEEVLEYRQFVDREMTDLLNSLKADSVGRKIIALTELGLQHEMQHQELLLMDVKYIFFVNPLKPAYCCTSRPTHKPAAMDYVDFDGGLIEMGDAGSGFAYDNENPCHRVFVEPFRLGNRLVTNGEYLEFVEGGGYQKPEYWLSDGWIEVGQKNWQAPLYWQKIDGSWFEFTLAGLQPLDPREPVCHVSYYEAQAFARFLGKTLPRESQWELAACQEDLTQGHFLEQGLMHPVSMFEESFSHQGLAQMFGDVWEWTQSAYSPYPGFKSEAGAVGEYNGKFMCNQMVMRGGACITSREHIRATYRNFFYPSMRWQFSGIRLAEEV